VLAGATAGLVTACRRTHDAHSGAPVHDAGTSVLVLAAGWLLSGLAALSVLRMHAVRYYVTLLPAAILLAAWWLTRFLECRTEGATSSTRSACRVAMTALLVALFVYPLALFGWYYGPRGGADWSGRRVGAWVRANLRPEDVLIGRAQYGIDLPNRYYDMTLVRGMALNDSLLDRLGVDYVLFDDAEWRAIDQRLRLGTAAYLTAHGTLLRRIGRVEVWRVERPLLRESSAPLSPAL
jgi:hypothetical protein